MKCRAMTRIMQFCMVLVVLVSVFFYAPMEVSASSSTEYEFSSSNYDSAVTSTGRYLYSTWIDLGYFNLSNSIANIDSNLKYEVELSTEISINSTQAVNVRVPYLILAEDYVLSEMAGINDCKTYSDTFVKKFVFSGSDLLTNLPIIYNGYIFRTSSMNTKFTVSVNIDVLSCVPISSASGDEYEAGYEAGLQAGTESGYSNGFSNGFQAGESAGYESGFQAGADSVDTQSYYDAGYQAGYQVAYSEGYESGYDVGFQSAMDRIASWGADTSDYPILLETLTNDGDYALIDSSSLFPYSTRGWLFLGKFVTNLNPSHTYKLVFDSSKVEIYESNIIYSEFDLNYRIGNNSYKWYFGENFYYISGSDMSSTVFLDVDLFGVESVSESDTGQLNLEFDYINVYLYDMGPSGDTQNHIANQTDQLTNGYDSSQGAAVNDDFKASVNEYHTAEDSLFSTATTSLENFMFLDFTSITGMVTSLSFVTSIMTSIYMAMGGDTGASGIILAVLFSVMLVSMAIGLYRYYVSNGKSDGSGKGGD